MDVVLLRWPGEVERRERLQAEGVPRLLLVDEGVAPPLAADCVEDWIRVPAGEQDVRARISTLTLRADLHAQRGADRPDLDLDGVLRFGSEWVSLPPVEGRLTRALLDRFGAVVGREALCRAGWPAGAPGRNALDVHVLRLRRRLDAVGLSIKTVRSRGYLLEASGKRQEHAREA
ncbi:MAG: winged helix-turn-helix domain-containing protein [Actinobacteria bacterium]|nr:winged helix-turn-helix domain-containing protein [Actinomycetota bacterium]MBW3649318.1 winged helix-turn-helix domain-containing protein [Actinomycetota bacterium]